jgi:periplasmic protein TonB
MKRMGLLAIAALVGLCGLAWTQGGHSKPARVRISSAVAEGLKIYDVLPSYPREAREKHLQGDVRLTGTIDKQGNMTDLKVIEQPDPLLGEAALKAVQQWRYKPYLLNGEPIEVETQILVRFHL